MYNLNSIDITKVVGDIEYAQEIGLNVRSFNVDMESKKLYMLNFNKEKWHPGLENFRSVITDGKKIVCFSPPKAFKYEDFLHNKDIFTVDTRDPNYKKAFFNIIEDDVNHKSKINSTPSAT